MPVKVLLLSKCLGQFLVSPLTKSAIIIIIIIIITSNVPARVPAAGKVLEGDDQPTLLREDQHYLHYITITVTI